MCLLRPLAVLLLTAAASAAPTAYTKNSMQLLDAGVKTLVIYHAPLGTTPDTATAPYRIIGFTPGAGERVRVWFSWQFNTPAASNTACTAPCALYWDLRHGDRLYWYEFVDSSGNALSPRKLSSVGKVTAEPNALETSIVLPIEVIGFRGYTRQIQFTASTVPSGTISLWMQIHALDYQNKAMIQVNNAAWISLNDSTVTFLDRAPKFGGIGGGFRTMKIAVALAASTVVTGTNIVRFKLGEGNNISNGFRVIKFNVMGPAMNMTSIADSSNTATGTCSATCGFTTGDEVYVSNVTGGGAGLNGFKTLASSSGTSLTYTSSGVPDATYNKAGFNAAAIATAGGTGVPTITVRRSLITQAQFSTDDPSTWTAPANGVSATGATLATTTTTPLKDPAQGIRVPTYVQQATCAGATTGCHPVNLRDLKYFGYSNNSIKIRSMFHDLDEQDGDDIAAYVRGLSVTRPANGRPYNPPYQPGAGLDAAAVANWGAGAGIDAVYERDADFAYDLLSANFAATANLNVRETRLPVQYFDWNHWLPKIHPLDGYGSVFTNSLMNTNYAAIRAGLSGTCANTSAYSSVLDSMTSMMTAPASGGNVGGYVVFTGDSQASGGSAIESRVNSVSGWEIRRIYSVAQWAAKVGWELNNEFCLESLYSTPFPSTAEPRGWQNFSVFDFSPNLLKLNGMANWGFLSHDENMSAANAANLHGYISNVWYFIQLSLNYHTGSTGMQRPQDWRYTHDFIRGFANTTSSGGQNTPSGALMLFFLTKGLQLSVNNNGGPSACPGSGSCFYSIAPEQVLLPQSGLQYFNEIPAADVPTLLTKHLQAVYDHLIIYSRADYLADTNENTCVNSAIERANGGSAGCAGSRLWYLIPQYKYRGVSSTLTDALANWAATIWTASGQSWAETRDCVLSPYQGDSYGLGTCYQ